MSERIEIDYAGSGVKTLRTMAAIILAVASLVCFGACYALAAIAENALYQKKTLEYKLTKESITIGEPVVRN